MNKNQSFFACDSVSHEGNTNTWFTPKQIIEPLGLFDLDPCTQSYRPFDTALRHICEDKEQDGLSEKWQGRVWLNPPYGRIIAKWLSKLAEHGNGIALVFARTDTVWAQDAIRCADGVNFLRKRIAFLKQDGKPVTNAGCGSMLLAFGGGNVEAIKKLNGAVFSKHERRTI